MAIAPRLYTLEEFEAFIALPENAARRFELINGEIYEKMPTEEQTRLVWLIYPEKRLVEVYRPGADSMILDINDTLDSGDVLPGCKLALKDLFGKLPSVAVSEDPTTDKTAEHGEENPHP